MQMFVAALAIDVKRRNARLPFEAETLFHQVERFPPLRIGQPLVRRQPDMPMKKRLGAVRVGVGDILHRRESGDRIGAERLKPARLYQFARVRFPRRSLNTRRAARHCRRILPFANMPQGGLYRCQRRRELRLQDFNRLMQTADFITELTVAAVVCGQDQCIQRAHRLIVVIVLAAERHQGACQRHGINGRTAAPPLPRFLAATDFQYPHHASAEAFAIQPRMQRGVFGIIRAKPLEMLHAAACCCRW